MPDAPHPLRILVAMPHFFDAAGGGKHGSLRRDPAPRAQALGAALRALHQLFGPGQASLRIRDRTAVWANRASAAEVEVLICATGEQHVLGALGVPPWMFEHVPVTCPPKLLGFECHRVLRDRLGSYDYYCFMEDDLVLHDPLFFRKLAWFTATAGPGAVLQPNRYEVSAARRPLKLYVDGDLAPRVAGRFRTAPPPPRLEADFLGAPLVFEPAANPHAGCFFLTDGQLRRWAAQPWFLDRCTDFVSPLESAATLGLVRTFDVYKAAPAWASFLELQHHGTSFHGLLGRSVALGPALRAALAPKAARGGGRRPARGEEKGATHT